MVVELLGGGASTESGHNRGPSLNLRNQHCSWGSLTRPLAFCSTISRDSAWLRPCIRTARFNAPAVLTGTPVHGGTRGWAQNPSRLHAHRDPLCLTLRLITATRVLPHGYPTNSCSSACRSLTLFELRATFLYGHNARADRERHMSAPIKNGSRASRLPFAFSNCHP